MKWSRDGSFEFCLTMNHFIVNKLLKQKIIFFINFKESIQHHCSVITDIRQA
jgi:hypothetical protein